MSDDLHYISAAEALRRFRERSLSPVELLDAVIERAEEVEPAINAFFHTRYEEARSEARAAEARYGGRGEEPRALEGIPLAVKDEEAIEGQPCTEGSVLFAGEIADHTTAFAERVLAAGAIVHARTTQPEFAAAGFTHSPLHGVTRNPWNPRYTPGGSSGGSGAALAAGTTTLASGSDIAGSIRLPASMSGVVGFKPPYGRVPVDPPFNLDTYCHTGPMARTVADAALFENVVAGPDPRDVATLRPKYLLPDRFDGIEGLRIALSPDLGSWPLDPEVRENTIRTAEALRDAGAEVEEVDLRIPRDRVMEAVAIHFKLGFGAWIAAEAASRPDEITAYARATADWAERVAAGRTFIDEAAIEAQVYEPIGELFEAYDGLVCATMGTTEILAGDDYTETMVEVDGQPHDYYLETFLTPVFNICSPCPVLNVPSGFASNGVPTGIQIVARTYDDVTAFRIAAAIEAAAPWFGGPESRPGALSRTE